MNFLRLFWSWLRSSFVPFLKTRVLPIFRHRVFRVLVLLLGLGLSGYLYYLDVTIREAFDGRKFAVPARVYGRALEVYPGLKLTPAQLVEELRSVGYRENPRPDEDATYRYTLNGVEFTSREFAFWDGMQPTQRLRVEFADGVVALIQERGSEDKDLPLLRLEPPQIGGIYPGHNEDRDLLRLSQVPQTLIDALIAIEDRKFYTHWGIDPRGIARALYKTLSGQRIEGGSTLTQQLVKNFFLTSERTLTRKANEVLMAMLLELHYSKDEILETYLNEIYLGQDRDRAIHGVGLAAQFYFGKEVQHLTVAESALLVALVKGPAVYDPHRHPARALERRNLVLREAREQNAISMEQYAAARSTDLGISKRPGFGTSPFPAFLALVHRQLRRDYDEADLRSEGLRIYTSLDPRAQSAAERALTKRLAQFDKEKRFGAPGLEGAVDYARLRASPEAAAAIEGAGDLARVDPAVLGARPVRLAFWINVYNALVLHGVLAFGVRGSVHRTWNFFGRAAYRVGAGVFTLEEIEHGLLRNNADAGIFLHEPESVRINSIVIDITSAGIVIDFPSTGLSGDGIVVYGGQQAVSLSDNTIVGSARAAILVDGADATLWGNETGDNGLVIDGTSMFAQEDAEVGGDDAALVYALQGPLLLNTWTIDADPLR